MSSLGVGPLGSPHMHEPLPIMEHADSLMAHISELEAELKSTSYLLAALIYKLGPQTLTVKDLREAQGISTLHVEAQPATGAILIELTTDTNRELPE